MPTVPTNPLARLSFYEAHITPWTTSATAIGLTSALVTAQGTRATDARAAYTAHIAAQAAAKAATLNFYEKMRLLHNAPGAGADMIRQIKTKALTSNDPNVYVLAEIPAPASPTPVGAPGTPTNFKATLNPDGSLKLTWHCPNPAGSVGTIYQIARQLDGGGAFAALTSVGGRTFTDPTIPAGSTSVTYRITAVRSTSAGTAGQFSVNFGTGASGGAMIASVVSGVEPAPKIAA
jgi:hypothetical protein